MDVGKHMVRRFIARSEMFGLTKDDIPSTKALKGPKDFFAHAKATSSKYATIIDNSTLNRNIMQQLILSAVPLLNDQVVRTRYNK